MTEENEQENERYDELNGMKAFSLADLAEEIGVSKGYISRRVGEEKDVRGYPVFEWAVRDGAGRVDHYRVPADAFEEADDPDAEARENTATADSQDGDTVTAKARVRSIRDVAREARERRENTQAERDREQLEADRKRHERAEQRRNARAKEREADAAHTYTVAEMADILDADESTVRQAVADGRDVDAFPVSEFAVIGEDGNLERFRVPHSAFEDATAPHDAESSGETDDPGDTQPDTAPKRRSGLGGLLALGAATVASAAMGAFDSE